jgi:acetyl-CoA C-acetyltransferase
VNGPLDPRTPVLVGQAQVVQHEDDVLAAWGPIELMSEAVRQAIADAGSAALTSIDEIHVARSLTNREPNPGAAIARACGITASHHTLTSHGGNTPQWLVNHTARRIFDGEIDCAVLVGGEAMRTRNRAKKLGLEPGWFTAQHTDDPAHATNPEFNMNHDAEMALRIILPIEIYPMFETALRARDGHSVDEHQRHIGKLWSRFSAVAATNEFAWDRTPHSADEIVTPTANNRVIGFPYTKLMNANNNVDMAASLIICSVERAQQLGVPRDRWVFPVAGTDCHEKPFVSHRMSFTDTPAIRMGGQMALDLAHTSFDDIEVIDLYSCFPSAVQIGAEALGLELSRTLTCTGGLTFAGGPFNNYSMHAIAESMRRIRSGAERAFVWANGGFLTKHSFGVYAHAPSGRGYAWATPQLELDALPERQMIHGPDAAGTYVVEAYSVMHDRDGAPSTIRAALLNDYGMRAWGISEDAALASDFTANEWVGNTVQRDQAGTLMAHG